MHNRERLNFEWTGSCLAKRTMPPPSWRAVWVLHPARRPAPSTRTLRFSHYIVFPFNSPTPTTHFLSVFLSFPTRRNTSQPSCHSLFLSLLTSPTTRLSDYLILYPFPFRLTPVTVRPNSLSETLTIKTSSLCASLLSGDFLSHLLNCQTAPSPPPPNHRRLWLWCCIAEIFV